MKTGFKTEAIVLKSRALSEKDRISTFLSPTHGKFDAVVKGVRKLTSKSMGKMEPMNRLILMVVPGKNLGIVTQSELLYGFKKIRKKLESTSAALFMLDNINSAIEVNEENRSLYLFLKNCLYMIEKGVSPSVVTCFFRIKFLTFLGFRPVLDACSVCGRKGDFTYLDMDKGGCVCKGCQAICNKENGIIISSGTLKTIRFLERTGHFVAARLNLHPTIDEEINAFVDQYMMHKVEGFRINRKNYPF